MSRTLEYIGPKPPSIALALSNGLMSFHSTVVAYLRFITSCSHVMTHSCRCCKSAVTLHAALLNLTSGHIASIVIYVWLSTSSHFPDSDLYQYLKVRGWLLKMWPWWYPQSRGPVTNFGTQSVAFWQPSPSKLYWSRSKLTSYEQSWWWRQCRMPLKSECLQSHIQTSAAKWFVPSPRYKPTSQYLPMTMLLGLRNCFHGC